MQRSATYVLGFAAAVCVVCAIFVSSAAVLLKDRQDFNINAFRQQNVLLAAGMLENGEKIESDELERRFETIGTYVVSLQTGAVDDAIDPLTFDMVKAAADPSRSRPAPPNRGGVPRVPDNATVYELRDDDGSLGLVVLPIWGKGLWGTLYGFMALDSDLSTIRGITFYKHKETPGLGGEVDNPRWKGLWQGRQAFDDTGEIAIEVIKGPAGSAEEDPYRVDGLTGATLTSRGVSNFVQFWLGVDGYGAYLDRLRGEV